MKKFFMLLAGWFIAVVAVIAGSYIYSHYQAAQYDPEAVPYILKIVPEISKWDVDITRSLMAPEVLESIPEENFVQAMEVFSRLGALESVGTPVFKKAFSDDETVGVTNSVVVYETEARYANGDALLTLKLLEKDGSFELFRFDLSSATLAR